VTHSRDTLDTFRHTHDTPVPMTHYPKIKVYTSPKSKFRLAWLIANGECKKEGVEYLLRVIVKQKDRPPASASKRAVPLLPSICRAPALYKLRTV
jgi:hypothetical protein